MVYVLRSASADLRYVGCTADLPRRLRQHNGDLAGGARFTRRGRPWAVARVYGPFAGRGEAQRAERAVKRLRGAAREGAAGARAAGGALSAEAPVEAPPRARHPSTTPPPPP